MRYFLYLILFTSTFLFANNQDQNLCECSCLKEKLDTNAYLYPYKTFDCQKSWQISASFIYYLFHTDIKILEVQPSNTITNSFEQWLLKSEYHPGFKVGVGKEISYDDLSLFLEYTFFKSTDKTTYTLPSNASQFNDYFTTSSGSNFADLKLKLNYQTVILDLQKKLYLSKNFLFDLLVGLKGGIINQKINANSKTAAGNLFFSNYKSDSYIIGPKIGFKSDLYLCKNFKLFDKINFNFLYQDFKITAKNNDVSSPANTNTNTSNLWKPDQITMNLDFLLGFMYERYFNNCNNHFDVSLSYDINYYFNQMYIDSIRVTTYRPDIGNFYLHGLDLRLRFDF
jgi:hypothetical protein